MRNKEDLPECPVATAISLVGNKWKFIIKGLRFIFVGR